MKWLRTNRTLSRLIDEQAQTNDLLLDHIDTTYVGIDLLAGIASQQEDIIESLTGDVHILRMERDNEASENVVLKQRIAELEAKLAKRTRKPKTEPTAAVGSEAHNA